MQASTRLGAVLLISVLLLDGCLLRRGGPDPGQALSRWVYGTQGYVPVSPPREDVRIGDVHLYLSDPESSSPLALHAMPRWSALPSSELLRERDDRRPANAETPYSYVQTGIPPAERSWPEAVGSASSEPPPGSRRLPSIQLPSFVVLREDSDELPPSWGILLSLAESPEDWKSIRIGIESAESDALALEDAIASYLQRRGSRFYLPGSLRRNLRALAATDIETVWIRIVTEVVYMRALRLTVVNEPGVDLFEEEPSSAGLGYGTEEGEEDAQPNLVEAELDPTYAAVARADAMNQRLIDSGADKLPDGFFRFLRVSDERTTARRVFRRATAIGVGGLSLRVDARTGEVQRFRLMGRRLESDRSRGQSDESTAIDAVPSTPLEEEPAAAGASEAEPGEAEAPEDSAP